MCINESSSRQLYWQIMCNNKMNTDMLMLALLVCAACTTLRCTNAATICNGLADLCRLRIDQATFPGIHNSGSGFDGLLYYWSGGAASSCFYRNQGKSFTDQLTSGIRYFDIDTCYGDGEVLNCHCGPDGTCAYTGSMEKALLQIDEWMKAHPSEVVIIHFNRDAQEDYRKQIAQDLMSLLLNLWNPNGNTNSLTMSTYYHVHQQWPTLGEAIQNTQRIFVFMDNNLSMHISKQNWLITSNNIIQSTWANNPVSSSCSSITSNAKSKCATSSDFIELSAFGSYGLCTWDMATLCSKWLGEAQEECYKIRKRNQRTVNFLMVDWATDYYSGEESVVNKAKFMNQKNIKQYLYKDVYFPELSGCSYHPGWFYNYCWKYCAEYGWCWVNTYCGNNEGICRQQDYPCYSSCGY